MSKKGGFYLKSKRHHGMLKHIKDLEESLQVPQATKVVQVIKTPQPVTAPFTP